MSFRGAKRRKISEIIVCQTGSQGFLASVVARNDTGATVIRSAGGESPASHRCQPSRASGFLPAARLEMTRAQLSFRAPARNPPDSLVAERLPGGFLDAARLEMTRAQLSFRAPARNPPDSLVAKRVSGGFLDAARLEMTREQLSFRAPARNPPDSLVAKRVSGDSSACGLGMT